MIAAQAFDTVRLPLPIVLEEAQMKAERQLALHFEEELWHPVVGYEGYYEVSNLGRVKSFSHKARILKQTLDPHGRPCVYLSKNCNKETKRVHILIAEAFLGPRPNDEYKVCHKDGNNLNSHLSNLYYGTMKENMADRERHRTTARGIRNGRTPLTDGDVREIRRLREDGKTLQFIADRFGVTNQSIWQIIAGITWTHVR